jgi:hypothetical protein
MLMRASVAAGLLWVAGAAAQTATYLPQPSVAAAVTRSQQMCGVLKAGDGVHPACDLVQIPTSTDTPSGSVLTFAAVPLEGVDPHVYVGEPAVGPGLPSNARVAAATATTVTLGAYGPGGNVSGTVSVAADVPAGTVITFGRSTRARDIQPTTDGAAAVVMLPGDDPAGLGLTAAEKAAALDEAHMGARLPWVLPIAQFQARLTPAELTALNASTDPAVATPWAAALAAGTINLRAPATAQMLQAALADGILAPGAARAALALVPVAAVPAR